MTVTRYFILTNSTQSLSKRFRVVYTDYRPGKEKSESVKKTLDGELDISQGAIHRRHEYLIHVRAQEQDTDYGTLADLDTFYEYNEPNPAPGNPSNRLYMTDHYGNQWIVATSGDFVPQPAGVMLEGPDALFFVRVGFLFLGVVEGS